MATSEHVDDALPCAQGGLDAQRTWADYSDALVVVDPNVTARLDGGQGAEQLSLLELVETWRVVEVKAEDDVCVTNRRAQLLFADCCVVVGYVDA